MGEWVVPPNIAHNGVSTLIGPLRPACGITITVQNNNSYFGNNRVIGPYQIQYQTLANNSPTIDYEDLASTNSTPGRLQRVLLGGSTTKYTLVYQRLGINYSPPSSPGRSYDNFSVVWGLYRRDPGDSTIAVDVTLSLGPAYHAIEQINSCSPDIIPFHLPEGMENWQIEYYDGLLNSVPGGLTLMSVPMYTQTVCGYALVLPYTGWESTPRPVSELAGKFPAAYAYLQTKGSDYTCITNFSHNSWNGDIPNTFGQKSTNETASFEMVTGATPFPERPSVVMLIVVLSPDGVNSSANRRYRTILVWSPSEEDVGPSFERHVGVTLTDIIDDFRASQGCPYNPTGWLVPPTLLHKGGNLTQTNAWVAAHGSDPRTDTSLREFLVKTEGDPANSCRTSLPLLKATTSWDTVFSTESTAIKSQATTLGVPNTVYPFDIIQGDRTDELISGDPVRWIDYPQGDLNAMFSPGASPGIYAMLTQMETLTGEVTSEVSVSDPAGAQLYIEREWVLVYGIWGGGTAQARTVNFGDLIQESLEDRFCPYLANPEQILAIGDSQGRDSNNRYGYVDLFSMQDPESPRFIRRIDNPSANSAYLARGLALKGRILAVQSTVLTLEGINFFQINSPRNVQHLGRLVEPDNGQFGYGLAMARNYLFVSNIVYTQGRVLIYDISQIATPQLVGTIVGPSGNLAFGSSIAADGDRLVVVDAYSNVSVTRAYLYNVANPANPLLLGHIDPPTGVDRFQPAVAISGDTMVIAGMQEETNTTGNYTIYDVSDFSNPVKLRTVADERVNFDLTSSGLALRGNLLVHGMQGIQPPDNTAWRSHVTSYEVLDDADPEQLSTMSGTIAGNKIWWGKVLAMDPTVSGLDSVWLKLPTVVISNRRPVDPSQVDLYDDAFKSMQLTPPMSDGELLYSDQPPGCALIVTWRKYLYGQSGSQRNPQSVFVNEFYGANQTLQDAGLSGDVEHMILENLLSFDSEDLGTNTLQKDYGYSPGQTIEIDLKAGFDPGIYVLHGVLYNTRTTNNGTPPIFNLVTNSNVWLETADVIIYGVWSGGDPITYRMDLGPTIDGLLDTAGCSLISLPPGPPVVPIVPSFVINHVWEIQRNRRESLDLVTNLGDEITVTLLSGAFPNQVEIAGDRFRGFTLEAYVEEDLGDYEVYLVAANQLGSGPAFRLTITVVEGVPRINSPTSAKANYDTSFNYQITATEDPTSFDADNLIDGLSINTSTGQITGTPENPEE